SVAVAADPTPSTLPSAPATAVSAPDWQPLEPTTVIDIPGAVGAIPAVTDGTTIWVAGAGQLVRIDAATNAAQSVPAPVAADDTSFLLADEGLWAARWSLGKLYRLDPATGQVELDVNVSSPVTPTLVGDQLWLGRESFGDMVTIDRATGAVGDVVPPGGP